jgi:hypothetical protein
MSNRRQTLGVLSANRRHTTFDDGQRNPVKSTAMRSRQSMAPILASSSGENAGAIRRQTLAAPARPAFGAGPGAGRKSAGGDRKSLGGGGGGGGGGSIGGERKSSGNRQSSSIAPNSKSSKYADPRPIKKKAYMEQEIREVIRFLCHHNYDHPITPKQLTQPTAKDFENIVLFLFTVVDRHYSFSGNIKHDIPLLYKGAYSPFIGLRECDSGGAGAHWDAALQMQLPRSRTHVRPRTPYCARCTRVACD